MVYQDIYVYTMNFFNFMKGFEIVKAIIDAVPPGQLEGYNFNRYSEEGDDRVPHITVRLNLRGGVPQTVKDLLDDMIGKEISNWCIDNPSVTPFREYSINHHMAHETSTACSFKFYEEMNRDSNEFNRFWESSNNKIRYLSDFLTIWLKLCGFRKLDHLVISTSQFIETLASNCAQAFQDTIDRTLITDKCVFTERLIHTFLNCICISYNEEYNIFIELMQRVGLMQGVFLTELSTSLEI